MNRTRAILIDAAGTLIRPVRPVGDVYAEVCAAYGATIDPHALTGAFRDVFPCMPPMAFSPVADHELDGLERGWWRRLVREVLSHCGAEVEPFDDAFQALYERFAESDTWETFAEVDTVLDRLRAAGIRLAIVSNFDSRLERITAGLGLDARVDAVVYSTRAGYAKPHPAIFAQALERLGAAPGESVHVGDSHDADFEGARAAGIDAWLLRRGEAGIGAGGRTVRDLTEFADRILEGAGTRV